jgi:hypothetical protein
MIDVISAPLFDKNEGSNYRLINHKILMYDNREELLDLINIENTINDGDYVYVSPYSSFPSLNINRFNLGIKRKTKANVANKVIVDDIRNDIDLREFFVEIRESKYILNLEGRGHNCILIDNSYNIWFMIKNKNKLCTTTELNKYVDSKLIELDKDEFANVKRMFNSNSRDQVFLALRILTESDLRDKRIDVINLIRSGNRTITNHKLTQVQMFKYLVSKVAPNLKYNDVKYMELLNLFTTIYPSCTDREKNSIVKTVTNSMEDRFDYMYRDIAKRLNLKLNVS